MDCKEFTKDLRDLPITGYVLALDFSFLAPKELYIHYPADWARAYRDGGMAVRDPAFAWGLTHTGFVLWKTLEDPDDVLAAADRHGLGHGLTVACLTGGHRSFASLSTATPVTPAIGHRVLGALTRCHARAVAQPAYA